MTKNMGTADRTIRIILAALFFILIWVGAVKGALLWALVVLGVVFLGTAAMGTCPLYIPLGISTKGKGGRS
jgi:hypothetical protein